MTIIGIILIGIGGIITSVQTISNTDRIEILERNQRILDQRALNDTD